MVRVNIGILNALIRITCGLTILAWVTSRMTIRPWRDSYIVVAMLAAMKVAEGITRFCPLTALFERYQQQAEEERNKETMINPT
jgi:hypothetical protein